MEKYIKKSEVNIEIERLEKINQEYKKTWKCKFKWFYCTIIGRLEVLVDLKQFLDTLEVKEVDLKKELDRYTDSADYIYGVHDSYFLIAKHFFELGLKVSNPTIAANQDNEWHKSSIKPPFSITMDGNRYSKPMLCYDTFGDYYIARYAKLQTGYCGWYNDEEKEVSITHWKELKKK